VAESSVRIRGRRTRDRRIADEAVAQHAAAAAAAAAGGASTSGAAAGTHGRGRLPDLSALTRLLAGSGEVAALVERYATVREGRVGQNLRHVTYAQMPHGAKSFLAAALAQASGERLVWLARDSEIADRVAEELQAWLGDPALVVTLEPRTSLAYERSELIRDESAARVATLSAWRSGGPRVLVAGVQALFQHTLAPAELPESPVALKARQRISLERVLRELVDLGYEALPEVAGRGEFARRGGIVDVFPAGQPLPVRIEWFGDEIESLRTFDPATQRGLTPAEAVTLLPASEFLLGAEAGAALRATLRTAANRLPNDLAADLARLEQGQLSDAAEIWAGHLAPSTGLDHLSDEIWVIDEPEDVSAAADFLWTQADERRAELERAAILPKSWPGAYPGRREWKQRLVAARTLELTWEGEAPGAPPGGNPFGWHEPVMPPAAIGHLAETIERWRREGARVVLASDQSARLSEILGESDIVAAPTAGLSEAPPSGGLALIERSLNSGFAGGPEGVVLVTDRELFGTVRVRRPRVLRRVVPKDLLERLQPGDLVVHIDHGIAKYGGMTRRDAGGGGGEERDFLELQFAESGRIWVPVEQIERVSRYAGGENPRLSRLGGGEWQRTKSRVRKAVTDLATELLELYSSRERAQGRPVSPDSPWQQEMEAAFPYEETVDQLRATAEVKADLERGRPMDRLVVGDVGYGKTEVALRAAFKAIADGMQVAVLVPTTVLAAQHLETFRQRFAAYPFSVRMLSRFVPADQQRDILAGLTAGSVDIVIGTHRLLSKDIRFRNLGLVVVDEEQRFGVAHKERLKQMRTEVHVLTLSATPIPRTLNLALAGVRDMSVIETPPEDRLPIQTRVAEASTGLVRDAILRELDRGGQVFFVHNRVETIEAQAEQLRTLLPQARIVAAHGQMTEGALERVMMAFARGEFDVLVCTTIIESGLDIPNANTIIIDRADALGLAQLYQLRGRVGRSSRRAYAYLLYRKRGQLSEIARKRLQAIFNASELGAGFQIALSDLEIRGAGNILGAEQHGHLAAVGFDLYTRLLSDAVEEQRAVRDMREPVKARAQTVIDLPVDAYLPDDYVAEEPQKLELYRRLGRAATEGEVATIRAELIDRFGALPGPVERLLEVARLRITADAAGIASLAREGHELIVRFQSDWSRSATMRAMAPDGPGDRIPGVPVGGISYGSNQLRVRLSREPAAAWATTRAIVERLAKRLESNAA
jgi:transcription-repair coupling factor (superfamily II helicase)